jgi:hypothetical protein
MLEQLAGGVRRRVQDLHDRSAAGEFVTDGCPHCVPEVVAEVDAGHGTVMTDLRGDDEVAAWLAVG